MNVLVIQKAIQEAHREDAILSFLAMDVDYVTADDNRVCMCKVHVTGYMICVSKVMCGYMIDRGILYRTANSWMCSGRSV